ncbi:MAG: glycosyltransferase family 39 protein [Actinobacteria bacterium]|nr:glycosyltransferase family 39 protein [Actinomycetota bacterium]MBU1943902.1 glycosyltransferase family 39 protein [Actinomycetota bacterium]MBU2688576.1 glycosyltransferase family 39 protein [Actinomycetota bacterium]
MKLHSRKMAALALVAILLLALLLRVFNVGHTLSYDEAWNTLSIKDAAQGATGDVFYRNFLRHPPAYGAIGVAFARATGSGRLGLSYAMEILAVLFGVGLVLAVFLCARDWFGTRAGLFSAFLLAVMPAARVYDSWVKPESLTLLLCLLFLFAFFRRQYVVAGLLLGLALLSKEIAVFTVAALLLFLLAAGTRREFLRFLASLGIGVAVSAWWYLLLSESTGEFTDFFLGRSIEAANWRQPWLYYLERVPGDAGWVIALLLAASFAALLVRLARHGWPVRIERRDASRMVLLPALWIVFIYAFLTFSYGKPPWLIYSALPPIALLCGWALSELVRPGRERAWRYGVVGAVLAAALATSLLVSPASFLRKADPTYASSLTHRRAAQYINGEPGGGRVLMRVNDLSPNFAFYLDSYTPGSITELAGLPTPGKVEEAGDFSILLMQPDVPPERAALDVLAYRPDQVVIRRFQSAGGGDLAAVLAGVVSPEVIGNLYVFDGSRLAEGLEPLVEPATP